MNKIYLEILIQLLKNNKLVGNTHELLNYQFTLNDLNKNIITIRKPNIKYILAETIWYFSGSNNSEWIGRFASMWNKITDDGKTSNSAYGYIIQKKHGFNQIEKIIELLLLDPNSRRAVININVPNEKVIETKDEMCTIALQFYIRNNKLYATGMMRSNDIWFGLPYDIIFFTELQKYIARRLKIEVGSYTHFVTSIHLYQRDVEKVYNIISNIDPKDISIDFEKLIEQSNELYSIVTPENIIQICKKRGIL